MEYQHDHRCFQHHLDGGRAELDRSSGLGGSGRQEGVENDITIPGDADGKCSVDGVLNEALGW